MATTVFNVGSTYIELICFGQILNDGLSVWSDCDTEQSLPQHDIVS